MTAWLLWRVLYSTVCIFSLILKALACVWNWRSLALVFINSPVSFWTEETITGWKMRTWREIDFLVKWFVSRFGCFVFAAPRSLTVDACSQNFRRVMKAEHGRSLEYLLQLSNVISRATKSQSSQTFFAFSKVYETLKNQISRSYHEGIPSYYVKKVNIYH